MSTYTQFLDHYILMMAKVAAETGRRLMNIFINAYWLFLVIDTATVIFRINFSKLRCQTVRYRHLPASRYIAVGQYGKNFLAFGI